MSSEAKEPTGAEEKPKSRIEVLEETTLSLIDTVEALAKKVEGLEKTAVKKTTQRFGGEHGRKAVKDTKTGTIYPSKFASGKALALEYELDPFDTKVYYQIMKKDPERLVEATDEEAAASWKKADAELAAEVEEANKAAAAEAKKAEEKAAAAAKAGAKTKAK